MLGPLYFVEIVDGDDGCLWDNPIWRALYIQDQSARLVCILRLEIENVRGLHTSSTSCVSAGEWDAVRRRPLRLLYGVPSGCRSGGGGVASVLCV